MRNVREELLLSEQQLLHALGHFVERATEVAELVVAANPRSRAEVARAEGARGQREALDWCDDPSRSPKGSGADDDDAADEEGKKRGESGGNAVGRRRPMVLRRASARDFADFACADRRRNLGVRRGAANEPSDRRY